MVQSYTPTHHCGALRMNHVGVEVALSGWVHRRRDHGGLIFIDLRDRYGITQLVFDPLRNAAAHQLAEKLRSEWVITISGKVAPRSPELVNSKLDTGEIEILIDKLEVLSKSKTPPFSISDKTVEISEEQRLRYRYLDIRRGEIADNLVIRHKAMMAARRYLDSHRFIEVSTPILGKSTPEGARDYLVPARLNPGSFFALPQSPQLFKQLLMVAGMDRYFQIAQCFRDEDLRADRQPEFTQIDIEMSFSSQEELMNLVEGLVETIFQDCIQVNLPRPFQRIPHALCIEKYGTDRPDLRFGMELYDITDIATQSEFTVFKEQIRQGGIVKALCVKGGADLSRKAIEDYTQFVGRLGIQGLAWMKMVEGSLSSNIAKYFTPDLLDALAQRLEASDQDLIFMISDQKTKTNQALDHLRRKIAKDRDLIPPNRLEFLWVTDFPLFSWNQEEGRLESEHHPFTSPHLEDLKLIDHDPLKVRSSGYDLVLNGYELGGGSQRIHDGELQKKIFQKLQLAPEELNAKFGFFIEALSYGTPPHLGLAIGLDRLIMILAHTDNIRDVIAFPKTQKASDLMMESPSPVTSKQLKELKISIDHEDEISWT